MQGVWFKVYDVPSMGLTEMNVVLFYTENMLFNDILYASFLFFSFRWFEVTERYFSSGEYETTLFVHTVRFCCFLSVVP